MKNIVITGSLGNISQPLSKALIEKGQHVSIISSHHERKAHIESLGATALIGSVDDADFLKAAFTGADAVYTMVPPDYHAADPIARYKQIGHVYAQAILHANVPRVVNLSSWGAHLPAGTGIIVGSHEVEAILNDLPGIAITHLRPTSFYNNLYFYIDMIKAAGIIGTNYGDDDKIVLVSPKDIADAALDELLQKTGSNIRYVASGEYTCNQIAAVLGKAIGKPGLQWRRFSDEQTLAAMEKNGVPHALAAMLVELNASIRTGLIRQNYDRYPPETMGKVKLEDFAKEFAHAYANK